MGVVRTLAQQRRGSMAARSYLAYPVVTHTH